MYLGIISLPWALLVQGVVLVLYKVRAINLSILFLPPTFHKNPKTIEETQQMTLVPHSSFTLEDKT